MHRILCDNIIQSTKAAYSHFGTKGEQRLWFGELWVLFGFLCVLGFFLIIYSRMSSSLGSVFHRSDVNNNITVCFCGRRP